MFFSFKSPEYLILLLVIPLLFVIHLFTINSRKRKYLKFANFEAIARIKGIDFFSKNWVILILSSLIILSIVLSLSGFVIYRTPFGGSSLYSFTIAVDSSQSMMANDVPPTRFERAKKSAINFIDTVPTGTNVSVISFSSFSYIEQEMTNSKSDAINAVNRIESSQIGGTDFYGAIENKAIILLSDGQKNIGHLDEIIAYAKTNGLFIYTIAIGTREGGDTGYGFISTLETDDLERISLESGGKFYEAQDEVNLALAFVDIIKLTNENVALDMSKNLLILAFVLFLLEFFLINTRYFDFI